MFLWFERLRKDSALTKRETGKLEFEAWPNLGNVRIWRVNFRSGVSSGASRPMEAMFWITEIESSKSIAELRSSTTTGAELWTNFEVLGLKHSEWPQENRHQWRLQKKSLFEGEAAC